MLTHDDILTLERSTGKKLPDWYRDFLLNYPPDLIGLGEPYNTVTDWALPNTAERLIEFNEGKHIPQNVLVIGGDGVGNDFFTLLDVSGTTIYKANHEDPEMEDPDTIDWSRSWELSWPDIGAFANYIREYIALLKD